MNDTLYIEAVLPADIKASAIPSNESVEFRAAVAIIADAWVASSAVIWYSEARLDRYLALSLEVFPLKAPNSLELFTIVTRASDEPDKLSQTFTNCVAASAISAADLVVVSVRARISCLTSLSLLLSI